MSTQRRPGGKENLMKLSLRNLFRNLTGRGTARKRSRPTLTTRLQVEQLEQRLVPTVDLSNMEISFGFGKGTLFVQGEQTQGGQTTFWGGFEDPNGAWIPIKGQLQQMGSWDQMTFWGSAWQHLVKHGESVNFNGWVNEANLKPSLGGTWVWGTLSETINLAQHLPTPDPTTIADVSGYAVFIPT
jgi:hypothetical protein